MLICQYRFWFFGLFPRGSQKKPTETPKPEKSRDEAAKLLNECFERQFAEADALLTRVREEAMAKGGKKAEK